jgi:hypothetical protein
MIMGEGIKDEQRATWNDRVYRALGAQRRG